jgi:peptidoglycan/LPS O-acetylase OafA/YrhL
VSNHPTDGHRQQLDGLRFLAFLGVFLFHAFGDNFADGALGVQLFFSLSGFLITRIILLNERGSIRQRLGVFYARRILRIFPLYYGVLVVLLILGQLPYPVWHFLYAQNFLEFWQQSWVGPPHFWSLCVEEQFYLTYPVILLLIPRSHRLYGILGLIGISALSTLLLQLFCPTNPMGGVLLPTSGQYLLWGSLAGHLDLSSAAKKLPANGAVAAGLTLFAAALLLRHISAEQLPGAPLCFCTLLGVSFACIVFGLWRTANRALLRSFSFGPFAYLGKISYGLYVYHLFCFPMSRYVVQSVPVPGLWRLHAVLAFLICVAIAALSWHLYESPINNLKRFFAYRRIEPAPAATRGVAGVPLPASGRNSCRATEAWPVLESGR